ALSDGNYESMDYNLPRPSGTSIEHGEPQAFRAAIPDVSLILGSTYDPQQSADAVEAGYSDAFMLARQLLADPDYPSKVLTGRVDEIVWCDHNNSCLRRLLLNVPVRCTKNPEMGREAGGAAAKTTLRQNLLISASGNPFLMGIADKLAS